MTVIKAFDIKEINAKSLNKLLATDLTKFVKDIVIETRQKDIELSMIMNEIMRNPNFEITVRNELVNEDECKIIVLIIDKRNSNSI